MSLKIWTSILLLIAPSVSALNCVQILRRAWSAPFDQITINKLQMFCYGSVASIYLPLKKPIVGGIQVCVQCRSVLIPLDGNYGTLDYDFGDGVKVYTDLDNLVFDLNEADDNEFCHESGGTVYADCYLNEFSGLGIINGNQSSIQENPWLSNLFILTRTSDGSTGGGYCGGAFISKNVIVTAKHCVESTFNIGYASYSRNAAVTMSDYTYRTIKFFPRDIHFLDGQTWKTISDIAVITLRESVPSWAKTFRPLSIANKRSKIMKGEMITVAGWGRYCLDPPECSKTGKGIHRQFPLKAVLPVTGYTDQFLRICSSPFKTEGKYFCAGYSNAHGGYPIGVFKGDSGSPAVCSNRYGKYLCGVVSGGYFKAYYPIGRAEPSSFLDATRGDVIEWINSFL